MKKEITDLLYEREHVSDFISSVAETTEPLDVRTIRGKKHLEAELLRKARKDKARIERTLKRMGLDVADYDAQVQRERDAATAAFAEIFKDFPPDGPGDILRRPK